MIPKQKTGFIKDAIYISHTSLNDFARCPRAYYLKNIYRNPKTGYKLQVASPYITLGATVHDAIDWYLKQEEKPTRDEMINQFRNFWRKFRMKKGGFNSLEDEAVFGKRGLQMVDNFITNADVLETPAPRVIFPKYNVLENVILVGNFDYVGMKEDDSLHVVDFKTGTKDEDSPLQLYLYAILAESNIQKPVASASFWYLDREDKPREVVMDPLENTLDFLNRKASEMKGAIQKNEWVCTKSSSTGSGLCKDCWDYQAIIEGKGEFMFSDAAFKKDIFYLSRD